LPIRAPHTILKSTVHHRTLFIDIDRQSGTASSACSPFPYFSDCGFTIFFELLSRALRRCGSASGKVID
jgi:hypothetical protein